MILRKRALALAIAVLAAALILPGPVRAHEEDATAIESYLHGLAEDGAITEAQHHVIEELYFQGHAEQLAIWLNAQETAGQLSADTHLYLNALLALGEPDIVAAAVPANYTGNGNVTLLGQLNPQPPSPYSSDNTTTGTLYLGYYSGEAAAANRPQLVVTYQ
jgi:hypothetical protein